MVMAGDPAMPYLPGFGCRGKIAWMVSGELDQERHSRWDFFSVEIHHRDTRYGRAQVLILIWKGDKRLEKHSTWKVAATYGSLCDLKVL